MANIGCKYKHQAKALKAHCQNLEMFVEKLIKEKGPTLEDAFAASELLMLGEILRGPAKPCSHQIICARQDVIEQALESYQNLKSLHSKEGKPTARVNGSLVQQDAFVDLGAALKGLAT